MRGLQAKTVFFVKDAQRSLDFYTETLGFSLDWNYEDEGRPFVFQVNLFGLELIVNQTEDHTTDRAGHGRVFVGLEDDQFEGFRVHMHDKSIGAEVVSWGAPTLRVHDLDKNELFFWLPEKDRETLEIGRSWP